MGENRKNILTDKKWVTKLYECNGTIYTLVEFMNGNGNVFMTKNYWFGMSIWTDFLFSNTKIILRFLIEKPEMCPGIETKVGKTGSAMIF